MDQARVVDGPHSQPSLGQQAKPDAGRPGELRPIIARQTDRPFLQHRGTSGQVEDLVGRRQVGMGDRRRREALPVLVGRTASAISDSAR